MRRTALATVVLLAPLAGCGEAPTTAPPDPPRKSTGELSRHGGEPCPAALPETAADGHGFGSGDPAPAAPTLPAFDRAWVCQYDSRDAGRGGADGTGTTYTWQLTGSAQEVPPSELPAVDALLAKLKPAAKDRMCTADLGPRFLLVVADGEDLTGVQVDAYGCREVRLTDDPHVVVAGASKAPGIVPGVLAGPESLLPELVSLHGAPTTS